MPRLKIALAALAAVLLMNACAPAPAPEAADPPLPAATQPAPPTVAPPATATQPALPSATPTGAAESATPAASGGLAVFVLVPNETVVSYAVDETFINENNRLNTSIGKTSQVTGELKVDLANPANIQFSEFTVDLSTLQSDSPRRDNAIRGRWLESASFPLAQFTVTGLPGFPASPQEGQVLKFQMTGDLTVRQTTRPVTWDVSATLNGDRLTGTATAFIMMADWGITPPNIAGILIVKDGVTLKLDFTFQKQS